MIILLLNVNFIAEYFLLSFPDWVNSGVRCNHVLYIADTNSRNFCERDTKQKNTIISAAEIGVLATVGKSVVKVAKQPKVMIVSTGDELVGVAETPLAHQIRRSNVFTLVSLLERLHIPSETAHITDDKSILKAKIASYLKTY